MLHDDLACKSLHHNLACVVHHAASLPSRITHQVPKRSRLISILRCSSHPCHMPQCTPQLCGFAGFEDVPSVPDSLLVCDSQQHLACQSGGQG